MFLPYKTDAPLYHYPIATSGMIAANTLIFMVTAAIGLDDQIIMWGLLHGAGYQPIQWVTCNFMHAGLMHLVGNMVGLWVFGMIVEGKVGWKLFVGIYMGVGVLHSIFVQTLMLFAEPNPMLMVLYEVEAAGVSVGASAAIFGLLAICVVWAPMNDVSVFVLVIFRPIFFEMPLLYLGAIEIGFQLVIAWFSDFGMSSELLHLAGVAAGFPVGIYMLKNKMVDCENWDLFAYIEGRLGKKSKVQVQEEKAEVRKTIEQKREDAVAQIRKIIEDGNPQLAFTANEKMRVKFGDWWLEEADMLKLMVAFHEKQLWEESIPVMKEYLRHYTGRQTSVRLKLAQILIQVSKRPNQAIRVLQDLDPATLNPADRTTYGQLLNAAEAAHDPYEVQDDDW